MTRYFVIFLIIILIFSYQFLCSLDEVRAVWIPAWELISPELIKSTVDDISGANFNLIFAEVRYRADALYKPNRTDRSYKNFEPRSPFLKDSPTDFDPLLYLLDYAHSKGISVHAWVTTFIATRKEWKEEYLPFPIEWFTLNEQGKPYDEVGQCWLDPALPQVQDYLINVFSDIVVNYPIDGFHLDYIRYPSDGFGHNPSAEFIFKNETSLDPIKNKDAFRKWKADKIKEFLSKLEISLHKIRPDMPISTAVIGKTASAYNDFGQRWGEWLGDGLVDFVVPMCYSKDIEEISTRLGEYKNIAKMKSVIVGIAILEREKDTYDKSESLIERIDKIRESEFFGYSIFSHETLLKDGRERLYHIKMRSNNNIAKLPKLRRTLIKYLPVVVISIKGNKYYSVKYDTISTHRYAILKAREIQYETDYKVYIKSDGDWYNIYVGIFKNKDEAVRLAGSLRR
ncbi:MAG: glycoside hydrolase family 10 protein [bacterium]